jgi:hypothetical protein
MEDPDHLLSEYLAARDASGTPPDPRPFLGRAATARRR